MFLAAKEAPKLPTRAGEPIIVAKAKKASRASPAKKAISL